MRIGPASRPLRTRAFEQSTVSNGPFISGAHNDKRFLDGLCVSDHRESTVYGIYLRVRSSGTVSNAPVRSGTQYGCETIRMTRAYRAR